MGLLFGAALCAPPFALAQVSSPQSAADCRAIADFTLRGQCWDALDRSTQQGEQVVRKRSFGLSKKPSAPEVKAAKARKKELRKAQRQAEAEGVDELTLTLAHAASSPTGQAILTATDGAVWRQTDTDTINDLPRAGATVHISKTSLGGYICQLSRWQSVRCQRER